MPRYVSRNRFSMQFFSFVVEFTLTHSCSPVHINTSHIYSYIRINIYNKHNSFSSRSLQVRGSTFSIADIFFFYLCLSRNTSIRTHSTFFSLYLFSISVSVSLALFVHIQIGFASTIWPPYNGSFVILVDSFAFIELETRARNRRESISLISLSFFLYLTE